MKQRLLLGTIIALYVVGTWVFVQAFQRYPSHSAQALFRWGLFYFVGAVTPVLWGIRAYREFQKSGIADSYRVRTYVLGPMVLGWLIMIIALGLIDGAV